MLSSFKVDLITNFQLNFGFALAKKFGRPNTQWYTRGRKFSVSGLRFRPPKLRLNMAEYQFSQKNRGQATLRNIFCQDYFFEIILDC
jgi:hypothetical protein